MNSVMKSFSSSSFVISPIGRVDDGVCAKVQQAFLQLFQVRL